MEIFRRKHRLGLAAIGSFWLLASGGDLFGYPWTSGWQPLRQPSELSSSTEVNQHPFSTRRSSNLSLYNFSGRSLDHVVRAALAENGLDFRVRIDGNQTSGYGLSNSDAVLEYSFSVKGIPLCEYQVKALQLPGGEPVILGSIPQLIEVATPDLNDWPSVAYSFSHVEAAAREQGVEGELTLTNQEPCLLTRDGILRPVWIMSFTNDVGLPYRGMADSDEAYSVTPHFFHATGSAKIYPRSSLDSALQEFTLNDLVGNGRLESSYFYTQLDKSSVSQRAYSSNHTFHFNPGTSEFEETSVFTNVTRTLQWYLDLGYKNFGQSKIGLVVHAIIPPAGANNALYQPGDSTKTPAIYVGDGDGEVLRNMATDTDVVSHEFGHHVVYSSVKSIEGEALVLHEGLADFFTFAKTSDPCLGESICPGAGGLANCVKWKTNVCLRSADNDYKFTDTDISDQEAHIKSQLVSGFLWDLRDKDGIPSADLSRLTLRAVDSLLSKSQYQHLILGLMIADKSLYDGKYCEKIYARAAERGFGTRMTEFSCNGNLPDPASLSGTNSGVNTKGGSRTSSSSKSPWWMCGVVHGHHGSAQALWLLLLPIVTLFRRKNEK